MEGTPEQIAARERFFKASQEARFLFKPESGIEALLKDLNDKGTKVIGFKELGERLKADTDLYLKMFNETTEIQTIHFDIGLSKLKEAISPYLSFHYI
jgi:hypothetical protein